MLTYPEVGATASGELPDGYRHVRRRVKVGDGWEGFHAVAAGMRAWGIGRGAGLRIRTEAAEPAIGVEFATGLGALGLRLWVPCRVVWLVDSAVQYGYGFGTLRGHPERGEEAFSVTLEGDAVWFEVRAFSRPDVWYARLGRPFAERLQDHVTDRYVESARRLSYR